MIRATLLALLSVLSVANSAAFVVAQDQQGTNPSKSENLAASLKVGDLAPELKVARWLQGEAVTRFEPGKVYVIDFWATWCGACIRCMPHLAELESRYKSKGVTVIGFTSRDILGNPGSNSDEKVERFVKKRGPMLGYRFAYAPDDTTCNAWMKAAGRNHLTCIFVVDRTGRIAYIGGPLFLNLALQKVLAENSNAKGVGDEMAKVEAEYQNLCADVDRDQKAFFERDPEIFFHALDSFEAKHPQLADRLPVTIFKLLLLLKQGNLYESRNYAQQLVVKAIEQRNVFMLEALNVNLSEKKENKELVLLAVRAAEALVRIDGGTNAYSLLRLAETHLVSGDRIKAKEYARKAIEATAGESADFQQEVEKAARKLGAEN